MPYTYKHPRPAITVDCAIFGKDPSGFHLLLIQRKNSPYENCWALPGGFLDLEEAPEVAAARELQEETGLSGIPLTQFHTFGAPDRDPREHVITIAHYAIVDKAGHHPQAADDAAAVVWFPVNNLPELAFDHASIIEAAITLLSPV